MLMEKEFYHFEYLKSLLYVTFLNYSYKSIATYRKH